MRGDLWTRPSWAFWSGRLSASSASPLSGRWIRCCGGLSGRSRVWRRSGGAGQGGVGFFCNAVRFGGVGLGPFELSAEVFEMFMVGGVQVGEALLVVLDGRFAVAVRRCEFGAQAVEIALGGGVLLSESVELSAQVGRGLLGRGTCFVCGALG